MKFNICTASDSYKFQHWNMYPYGTETVYSYFESRKGAEYDKTVFFGLQFLLKEFLEGQVVTQEGIDKAEKRINAHLDNNKAFNREGWEYILNEHGGRLPVRIKAVAEGIPVSVSNVMMTVENTDPKCYWLTNYLETLLTHVWSTSTVATASYYVKQMMLSFLKQTSDDPETAIMFMLHDFGFRGVSSFMSAAWEGAGHLVNFYGTDTFPAVEAAMDYYDEEDMPAFSVPATEHSIMTSLHKVGEMDVLEQLLDEYPTGILSVVIDSYDYRAFIREAARRFKDRILARDGKLVFRPDSGTPCDVTMECFTLLEEGFGSTVNGKGYKTLNPKVGILWGDGIDPTGIRSVLYTLETAGIAADVMVFGMGGGLLQKINRDTQRFAFKSSYQERNGVGYDIFKNPIDSSKASKRGKFVLTRDEDGEYKTTNIRAEDPKGEDLLQTVFENGYIVREYNFKEVRENAKL